MYKVALKNILHNRTRSALAIIGLSIAIVGLITLISLSAGIRSSIEGSFSQMSGITAIEDGATEMSSSIDLSTANKIEEISGVKVVSPVVETLVRKVDRESPKGEAMGPVSGIIMGIDPNKELQRSEGGVYKKNLKKGSFLRNKRGTSILISKDTADEYDKSVGSKISVNNEEFTVVGIYQTGSQFLDMSYVIPIEKARDMRGMDKEKASIFQIGVEDPNQVEEISQRIEFKTEDLEARSMSGWGGEMEDMMEQMNLFFIAVSSIAVLVGAIGILNTMLMSVMERTKEFGVLKAMGWTKSNIIKLVVLESLFLGIIGGVVGIVIGVGMAKAAELIMTFPTVITPELIIAAMAISVILGLIGGTYPAWKASKLDPVEAIRME